MLRNAGWSGAAAEGYARRALPRSVGALAIGLGLAACEAPEATQDKVYLPDTTPRISAPVERGRQLATGTYSDDFPELTGAPGPHGEHPAYVPATRQTVFRDEQTTPVAEQATATASELRAASIANTSTRVSEVEIEQGTGGRSYVVLKDGS